MAMPLSCVFYQNIISRSNNGFNMAHVYDGVHVSFMLLLQQGLCKQSIEIIYLSINQNSYTYKSCVDGAFGYFD